MKNLIFLTFFSLMFGILGGFLCFYVLEYFKVFPYLPLEQVTVKKEIKIEEKKKVLEEAVDKAEKSVFLIKTKERQGCGFILTSDGLGITLAENLKPSKPTSKKEEINFFFGEEKIDAQVIKIDEKQNLALVKLNKKDFSVFSFIDLDEVKPGTAVFLVAQFFETLQKEQKTEKLKKIVNEGIIKSFDGNFFETNILEKEPIFGAPVFNFETKFLGIAFEKNGKVFILPVPKIKSFANL